MALTEDLAMFQRLILESARQKILFLPHAIRQMSRPDRMITVPDVRRVVTSGEIIENYLEDARGHSCLLVGADRQGRWIHVLAEITIPGDHYRLCARPQRVGRYGQSKEPVMKCIHCEGQMKKTSAPFHIDRKGYHLSLNAVPAWVCGQCGEPYFEEREVRTIQRLLSQLDKQTAGLASVA